MPFEHVNRRGDRYLLQASTTRTGKPRYYFARKLTGTALDSVPEGYEVYEKPENAQVFLRKAQASSITPAERDVVAAAIRRDAGLNCFLVEIEEDSLVVYVADRDPDAGSEVLHKLFGGTFRDVADTKAWMLSRAHYTKMLRFMLADEAKRLFTADRWCFLGSIDNWFPLSGPLPLDDLAGKYVKHLGRESFFELM